MPWHAGILELWHTIKSEGILDLRNGFRKGRISLKRGITRLKSQNLSFLEFLDSIPDIF